MKKRITMMLLASAMLLSVAGCGGNEGDSTTTTTGGGDKPADSTTTGGGDDKPATEEGKVLNIWCWNNEFQSRVEQFYPGYTKNADGTGTIDGVTVKWTINANENNGYQIPLDAALADQDNTAADDKIDIFLIEADYADKYVNSTFSLPVSEVGITDDNTKDMYQYTKDIAKDKDGNLKAVSWQAAPGLFAYKRSIAKAVLGTDDPDKVQEAVADWTKFEETAKKMKDAGYFMLSGYDDAYRTFSNNVSAPWVNEKKEIIIDDNIMKWVEQTKKFTEAGYNNGNGLWSDGWAADQSSKGKVFGFFYSTWGINFTLLGNSLDTPVPKDDAGNATLAQGSAEWLEHCKGNGAFGDYAVCYGPQAYYWGGTWLCAGYATDNKTLVNKVMYNMTCNAEVLEKITRTPGVEDYTNNVPAMEAIANDANYKSDFLGGQNHVALFTESAKKIDMSNISAYDQGLNETFQAAMKDYFTGAATLDAALDTFYKNAITKYPALVRPAAE